AGESFLGVTSVSFGGIPALRFNVNLDGTAITATAPPHTAGLVDITVTNQTGSDVAEDAYEYIAVDAPVITGISPDNGFTIGGTSVTITGTHLLGASAVKFGDLDAVFFHVVDDSTIIAYSPAQAPEDPVHVTVITPTGTSDETSDDLFTYNAIPV